MNTSELIARIFNLNSGSIETLQERGDEIDRLINQFELNAFKTGMEYAVKMTKDRPDWTGRMIAPAILTTAQQLTEIPR